MSSRVDIAEKAPWVWERTWLEIWLESSRARREMSVVDRVGVDAGGVGAGAGAGADPGAEVDAEVDDEVDEDLERPATPLVDPA